MKENKGSTTEFLSIREEEEGAYQYGMDRLRSNPRVSPMQAINLHCMYLCEYVHKGEGYECQNKSCPFGILKAKMAMVSDKVPEQIFKEKGKGQFIDATIHECNNPNAKGVSTLIKRALGKCTK